MDDIDSLLTSFLKLGTTDHAELVSQFQAIIEDATEDIAQFFLDANNWMLQVILPSLLSFRSLPACPRPGNGHRGIH